MQVTPQFAKPAILGFDVRLTLREAQIIVFWAGNGMDKNDSYRRVMEDLITAINKASEGGSIGN